jgi:fatty-acyl-CoA synthase
MTTTPAGPWSGATIGSLALRILRRHPDRVAFSWDRGSLTYAEAAALIGRFQAVLAGRGLTRGARIGLLAANNAEAWCAGIAVQASGMTASWLHPLGSLDDQLYQLADLGAAACLVDTRSHGTRAAELAQRAGDVPVLGLGPSDVGPDLLARARAAGPATARDTARPEDVAQVYLHRRHHRAGAPRASCAATAPPR